MAKTIEREKSDMARANGEGKADKVVGANTDAITFPGNNEQIATTDLAATGTADDATTSFSAKVVYVDAASNVQTINSVNNSLPMMSPKLWSCTVPGLFADTRYLFVVTFVHGSSGTAVKTRHI